MGKTIERLAKEKGHEIVYTSSTTETTGELKKADVAIEFSTPERAVLNITQCFNNTIPVVSGTTGWLDNYNSVIEACKNCNGSFIYASNFSVGVNIFFDLNNSFVFNRIIDTRVQICQINVVRYIILLRGVHVYAGRRDRAVAQHLA